MSFFYLKTNLILGIKNFEERRLGENKNCNVTLQLNTDTKKFKCGDNSRPQIIHCNNPDECNSVFVLVSFLNSCNKQRIYAFATLC